MIILVIFISSSISFIFFINKIIKIKKESLKNKLLFIDEYRNSELNNHPYTINNYKNIKKWIENKYPIIEYINEQDRLYSQNLFKEEKDSLKYKTALAGKYDIAKLKQEIEFDTLRECFVYICKNDSKYKTKDFLYKNKNLVYLFTQNIIFTKKITQSSIILSLSFIFAIISLIILLY